MDSLQLDGEARQRLTDLPDEGDVVAVLAQSGACPALITPFFGAILTTNCRFFRR